MRRLLGWLSAVSLLLVSVTALGQTATTGSIEGVVTDPNGAAVSGATVSVTSPNLISPQTATTDDTGRFRIHALPPGTYKVTVQASGFAPFEKENIVVNLGRTANTDAQLGLAGASATVNITTGAAIDAAQNTTGSNVPANNSQISRPSERSRGFTQLPPPLRVQVCAMRPVVIQIRPSPDLQGLRTTIFWMA